MNIRAVVVLVTASVATIAATDTENASCGCGYQDPPQGAGVKAPEAGAYDLQGAVSFVHDPTMVKEGKTYYVFATGNGIPVRTSTDRIHWEGPTPLFPTAPTWAATTIPGWRNNFIWAPHVAFFDHKWHVYYAISTFGSNRSAIGLATNETLDPKKPNFKWEDQGPVVESQRTDPYNAIDPHVAFDRHGDPWLTFGSFWSGIKLVKLDAATGKLADPAAAPLSIASRPRPGAIEAPCIIRHGKYFYLFASFDFCCRGVNSTYNIRVGRSAEIVGPYVDQDGKQMMDGGGTLVLGGSDRWRGPGHNSILHEGRQDFLVFHSYDAQERGIPKLRILPMDWSRDDWPIASKQTGT